MTFELYYASRKLMQITRVLFMNEQDAYLFYGRVRSWLDVVRVRLVDGGEIVHDDTIRDRMSDPDWDKQEKIAELVGRMDRVFTFERSLAKATPIAMGTSKLTVSSTSSDVCWCGHMRIEHDGRDSTGYCHAQCVTRCGRFRKKP